MLSMTCSIRFLFLNIIFLLKSYCSLCPFKPTVLFNWVFIACRFWPS